MSSSYALMGGPKAVLWEMNGIKYVPLVYCTGRACVLLSSTVLAWQIPITSTKSSTL